MIIKKQLVSSRKSPKPSYSYLIEKKRDDGEFLDDEIRYVVDSILEEKMPKYQQAAWVMAVYFQGMSAQETASLAEEMMWSGETLELTGISRPKVDKYSTGGVGDKTTLVLGPLAAAAGVAMPTMNGVDEEFLISNLLKLSSIPGFSQKCDVDDFLEQVKTVSCAFVEQHEDISPGVWTSEQLERDNVVRRVS